MRASASTSRVDAGVCDWTWRISRLVFGSTSAMVLRGSIADGTAKPSLADEIAALEGADKIDEELEEMKRALGKGGASESEGE